MALVWLAAPAVAALVEAVEPREPRVYAAVALALLGTTLLASWVPARRAASTDPAATLRE
jgi:hypothetical protein